MLVQFGHTCKGNSVTPTRTTCIDIDPQSKLLTGLNMPRARNLLIKTIKGRGRAVGHATLYL